MNQRELNLSYPWVISMVLPEGRKPVDLARHLNRQDAESHLRFLQKYVKDELFVLAFDLVTKEVECSY